MLLERGIREAEKRGGGAGGQPQNTNILFDEYQSAPLHRKDDPSLRTINVSEKFRVLLETSVNPSGALLKTEFLPEPDRASLVLHVKPVRNR